MSSRPPLNRQPLGLLGFFELKNGGRMPEDLVPTLQPTLDLYEHYGNTNSVEISAQTLTLTPIPAGTGRHSITFTTPQDLSNGADLVVPQYEWWWILEASVWWYITWNGAGASRGDWVLESTPTPGPAASAPFQLPMDLMGTNVGPANAAAVDTAGARVLKRPVWLAPATTLYYRRLIADGAQDAVVQAYMRIARFRV